MRINLNPGIEAAETAFDKTASSQPRSPARTLGESQFTATDISAPNLTARALAAPEVRQEKVAALRAQIQSGTYEASSRQIASSIFEALQVSS
jgi:flagellar biosynthesis anti-sigma factor FlgM